VHKTPAVVATTGIIAVAAQRIAAAAASAHHLLLLLLLLALQLRLAGLAASLEAQEAAQGWLLQATAGPANQQSAQMAHPCQRRPSMLRKLLLLLPQPLLQQQRLQALQLALLESRSQRQLQCRRAQQASAQPLPAGLECWLQQPAG
jgi:hypothetical protein